MHKYQTEEKARDILDRNVDVVEKYQRILGDVERRVQACLAEISRRQKLRAAFSHHPRLN